MGQGIVMEILATFGPLQAKQIALGAGIRHNSVTRSLHGLVRSGELRALWGHGRAGGDLCFYEVVR